jgi:hypothetical protein
MKKVTYLVEPTDAHHGKADDAIMTSHPTEELLPDRSRPESADRDHHQSA